jgi:hypothetical protein
MSLTICSDATSVELHEVETERKELPKPLI